MTTTNLSPDQIRTDGGTQPRRSVNEATSREYCERMKAGDQFPPIEAFFDGVDYWLTDGFHRLDAHQQAFPGQPIACQVREGSVDEARWHSYGVNRTHGLRRTNADKARAVRSALRHPLAADRSDRQIAEHIGVSRDMVIRYRHAMESEGTCNKTTSRTGRDGRKINTANIGRKSRRARNTRRNQSPKPPPRRRSPVAVQSTWSRLRRSRYPTTRSRVCESLHRLYMATSELFPLPEEVASTAAA